jgi:hypothetical protein
MPAKREQISGPINVARLEGEVNGIKKVLYVFFDIHLELGRQTECMNPESDSVKQYIAKNLSKLDKEGGDKTYDFFLEIQPNDSIRKASYYTQIYLNDLRKLYNLQIEHNIYKKTRFHYIDIRNYTSATIIPDFDNAIENLLCRKSIDPNMGQHIKVTKYFIDLYYKGLKIKKPKKAKPIVPKSLQEPYTDKDLDENTLYLINKATTKYHHKNVKSKVVPYFTKIIDSGFKTVLKHMDSATKTLNEMIKDHQKQLNKGGRTEYGMVSSGLTGSERLEYLYKMYKDLSAVRGIYLDTFGSIVDMYFVRRFLDKDYITNAVVYTGLIHSNKYVHFLVKHAGFKITHIAYSNLPLDKLNADIKKQKDHIPLGKLSKNFIQCSDMSSFPELFK